MPLGNSPFRKYILGLETKVPLANGQQTNYINFDNAATTPPLYSVIKTLNDFAPWYSSIHRGQGYKSLLSSEFYEDSRKIVLNFVKGNPVSHTVVYGKNTTEAINKLSYRLSNSEGKNVILTTEMEHHSNDLPWRNRFTVDYIKSTDDGSISLADLESKLIKYNDRVRLITLTGASNVTGYKNPIYKAAGLAHHYHTKILIDAAQLIPHSPIDMKHANESEKIDFLVFSAHKMYAPFGTGVLIAPKETFLNGSPEYSGGGTVKVVTQDNVYWDLPPHKEEAGTPNIMGIIALMEAINSLTKFGLDKISNYEEKLCNYTAKQLQNIPDLKIYNTKKIPKVAIIPFNIKGIRHDILARCLSHEAGIAVRNGCFCAQPYIQKILKISPGEIKRHINNTELHPGLVRISFGMYNTYEEINKLIEILNDISKDKNKYLRKYS
ncbi:aminotransferase class V-fold PLP-dependent enzyme [Iocasia frigidifontis]|uniref:Aminotransferase class V-fold PLP-dependent enzyme n=1 Tax=Iocasia fonsfrigidae TaxID=2682810 RepID=A0A8A7K6G5_9FIRM|nr:MULTISPECIES: aminotransferase class V-fold PLP-dependent enzyme [Halanaerobiaceae]AZO93820.1 aminotransferase class V-fold PLP-dependent enzyme [Halocella sp. SP3-1]QTL96760.1 aminotransferase class V-fold PLP-dependent enzyme [Iocasia fonsfrigidae]